MYFSVSKGVVTYLYGEVRGSTKREGGGGGASEVLPRQKGVQKKFQPCRRGRGTTRFKVV